MLVCFLVHLRFICSIGACDDGQEHNTVVPCQSLVRIVNPNDRLCLARALLIGIRHWRTLQQQPQQQSFPAFRAQQQQHRMGPEARNLLRRAGISRRKHLYDMGDVHRLQQWLNEQHGEGAIRLVVFKKEAQFRIVYKGATPARFNLCLLLERDHYHYIGRPEQLFQAHRFCVDCERRVERWTHPLGCKVVCRACLRYGHEFPCRTQMLPTGVSSQQLCQQCLFVFANNDCYQHHLQQQQQDPIDGRGAHPFRSLCQLRWICRQCKSVVYARAGPHQCHFGNMYRFGALMPSNECQRCKCQHSADLPCYIQPIRDEDLAAAAASSGTDSEDGEQQQQQQQPRRKKHKPIRLCIFDIETSQDTPLQLNTQIVHKHVPMLLIAEIICEYCIQAGIGVNNIGQQAPQRCVCGTPRGPQGRQWCSPPFRNLDGDNTAPPAEAPTYNPRRLYFHSFDNAAADPIDQFLDFLLNTGPKNIKTVCVAHNGGKYDFHLVLEALHRRNSPPKRICTTGLKIYSMHLGGNHKRAVIFKDSLNYFFCELDALTRTFSLPAAECTPKPFFPYLYIQLQHLHTRLQTLPDRNFYQPDHMKIAKRDQFDRWYTENYGSGFQLREQLILYCVNDVAILRESVLRFRQLIMQNTKGLDPFLCSSTAAGLAMATMRRCFLPERTLVHSPEGGYLRGRRASVESQRYIRLYEMQHPGTQVQCASWAIGEAHVEDSGYRVDGYVWRPPPQRPLVIEYLGCFFHGKFQQNHHHR